MRDEVRAGKFSHIYVERQIMDHPRTRRILDRFPDATVIEIDHYKDVFCRSHQDYLLQHESQALILAAKQGQPVYEGAKVCQSFGNAYFYYTSCVMNCIYDCAYCYLKGMYPSGNLVVFVNLEDIFTRIEQLLREHRVYLCISYDTDLLPLEPILGYVREWAAFAEKHTEDLRIELRTKSGFVFRETMPPNLAVAYTLSPEYVIEHYEHGTPSLSARLASAQSAHACGAAIRFCFDPIIYCPDVLQRYDALIDACFRQIEPAKVADVSVGSFRISQDYMKRMRRQAPASAVIQFPYENTGGVYHYPEAIRQELEGHVLEKVREYVGDDRIFLWEEE